MDPPGSSLTQQAGPQVRAILSHPDFTPFLSPELSSSLGSRRMPGWTWQDSMDGTRQYLLSLLTAPTGAPGCTEPNPGSPPFTAKVPTLLEPLGSRLSSGLWVSPRAGVWLSAWPWCAPQGCCFLLSLHSVAGWALTPLARLPTPMPAAHASAAFQGPLQATAAPAPQGSRWAPTSAPRTPRITLTADGKSLARGCCLPVGECLLGLQTKFCRLCIVHCPRSPLSKKTTFFFWS